MSIEIHEISNADSEKDQSIKVDIDQDKYRTAIFPYPWSDIAGSSAIIVTDLMYIMEYIIVRYACHLMDGRDDRMYRLAHYGYHLSNYELFREKTGAAKCKMYDSLMDHSWDTLKAIVTWPISNYIADGWKFATPTLCVAFVLYYLIFSHRHPTKDSQGNRYWGNTIIFWLMMPTLIALLVLAFVTDGHGPHQNRMCLNQDNIAVHLMCALFAFGGMTLYGMTITISLLVDIFFRKTVQHSIPVWMVIIFGGLCNIGCVIGYLGFLSEMGPTGTGYQDKHYHKGGYVSEWIFVNVAWAYFLTIPMLTMWAEPTTK